MAFQLSLEDKTGCTRANAYARVCFYAFDEDGKQGRIVLNVYNSKADRATGKPAIPGEQVEININAENEQAHMQFNKVLKAIEQHGPKKVAYVIAKKMAQLKDAQDILEDGQTALTDTDVGLV